MHFVFRDLESKDLKKKNLLVGLTPELRSFVPLLATARLLAAARLLAVARLVAATRLVAVARLVATRLVVRLFFGL